MQAARRGPLRDVIVVDLTRALSGPFATMMLADMGADVIKVESPEGDISRFGGPFTRGDTQRVYGGYFGSINRNKRSVVLDLAVDEDKRRFLALIERADIVIENFRPGVMEGLGLAYEVLREINPRLVYGAIRGFGDPRTGQSPYADWPAFDIIAQAMGGVMSYTGTEDGHHVAAGPSIGDIYPATVLVSGVLAALHHARATGEGQFVDVAMMDALVALCEGIVWRYSYTGQVQGPRGSDHVALCPFGIYETADGACAIAAPTPKHWALLCEAIGQPELIEDERTKDNRSRVANRDFVAQRIHSWTKKRSRDTVVKELAGLVPVGPMQDASDLFSDPHVEAREMLVAVEHVGAERPVVYPNTPIKFQATPGGIYRRPPILGEHNEELFDQEI
jgi:crotonobetainyl-CoA:carnitine CoA-transferase CaiB-like acyl-CoA transferase